ncbi:MAG: pyridoxal phosphate-dependent aminotransferase [Elusimicrobiota bacterium]|jgi:aspartate aminotransferase|nr:pyridoxal phosphate-dependent aminotransferase [Elusimicrobiota bacterium]
MIISKRVRNIKPSPTLAIDAKAKLLKSQGVDIINFGPGEPDFDTPDHIKDAAIKAIRDGYTKYIPVGGSLELKEAIIEKFKRDNNLNYSADEIIVSCGAKHSIYNIIQSIADPGDEIIFCAPFWVSYPDMIILADAKPVIVNTKSENKFKVLPDDIRKAITKKTKALIINSPSNPTGATYCKKELAEIAQIALENNILIIADDIYEKFVYDGFTFTSIASISKEVKDITIVVNGVSKGYAMTGWRIGYTAGPKEIISAMAKVQSQSTSNPTSISVKAAVSALSGTQEPVYKMRQEFQQRRNFIVDGLNAIEGIKCIKPEGAFYVFPSVKYFLGSEFNGKKIETDLDFANFLLEQAHVAVVGGTSFGASGYMRLSYATSINNISKGLERIAKAVKLLK